MLSATQQTLHLDDALSLKIINDHHAEPLLALINTNRQHLRQWLPWVDNMQTVADCKAYISQCKKLHNEGSDFAYVIMMNETLVGRIGIHYIHQHNKFGAIGYWIGEEWQGKGIITKACMAILNFGFETLSLNRIEIKCATGNNKSRSIPERLLFTQEGILRQAEKLHDGFIDLYIYAMLKDEWQVKKHSFK